MSTISPLVSSLNAGSTTGGTSAQSPQAIDFMKLLMAQMRNQNPMDPQTGTEFMGQIAQFSQLDGINKLNQNFASLLTLQGLTQGASLIGKNVTYTRDSSGATSRGVVGSVVLNSGKVQLMIGGNAVDLSQIRNIEAGPTNTSTT